MSEHRRTFDKVGIPSEVAVYLCGPTRFMADMKAALAASGRAMSTNNTKIVKLSIEVITLPVGDVERALRFYVDQVGFALDVDYAPNDRFRVVQLTPPGSNCSIQIGRGLTDAPAGSLRNVYLVVTDVEAARNSLLQRGVKVGEIRHKVPIDAWDGGFEPGLDPARRDYASFANFSDPDGNGWVLQERGYRKG